MLLDNPVFAALYTYTKGLSVALGYRDQMTQLHSERVLGLAEEIGRCCGLISHELDILKIAASFHDIGKIGIPDHILLKPTHFEDDEWEHMKKHSEIGEKIMSATDLEGSQQAALAIRHHHEHYDGSGYPDGISGENIPMVARIISIADCYDAMAVTRSYQIAKSHAEIMSIMHQETGEKHDPALMHLFCGIIESSKYKAVKV
jgi:response regulator RpfG family c-di-GMP phosphodiesterase